MYQISNHPVSIAPLQTLFQKHAAKIHNALHQLKLASNDSSHAPGSYRRAASLLQLKVEENIPQVLKAYLKGMIENRSEQKFRYSDPERNHGEEAMGGGNGSSKYNESNPVDIDATLQEF